MSTLLAPRRRLAEHQLAIHRARLVAYQQDMDTRQRTDGPRSGQRTVERWRGETLQMGVLYEGVAVDFWTGVVANARAAADDADQE